MQNFPRFVSFAELKLNRDLRVGGMETSATLTTAIDGSVALPTGYLEMREVKDASGRVLEASAVTGADWQHGPYSGTPLTYYIKGSTFYAIPTAAATFSIVYYTKITPLTAVNDTNWLLTDAPLLYLYSVLVEVLGWAVAGGKEDMAKVQAASALRQNELQQYLMQDSRKRYSNSRITSRGVNP